MKGCQATGYLNKSKQCGFTCFDPESSSRQQQQQITDNKVMSDPGEKQCKCHRNGIHPKGRYGC